MAIAIKVSGEMGSLMGKVSSSGLMDLSMMAHGSTAKLMDKVLKFWQIIRLHFLVIGKRTSLSKESAHT